MRYFAIFAVLCASTAFAQGDRQTACNKPPFTLSDSYVQEVLRNLKSPESSRWPTLIRVSLVVTGSSKLVLWTDGETFALDRGTPQNQIYQLLDGLNNTCQLPSDPVAAAKRVNVTWEHATVLPATFEQMHHELVGALTKNADDIQDRYSPILKDRAVIVNLHTPEYRVEYDNIYQQLEFVGFDSTSDAKNMNPIVAWAHSLQKFAESTFNNKEATPSH